MVTSTPANASSSSIILVLLRGPIIIAGILISVVYPLLNDISIQSWIQIAFFCTGLAMTVLDVFRLAQEKTRSSLQTLVKSIVLDDILRALFDKEGLFAVMVSTFVGNAAMYNFVNEDQRTRLVGACFGTHQREADTILHSPGGILKLFPDFIQHWVNDDKERWDGEEEGTMKHHIVEEQQNTHAGKIGHHNGSRCPKVPLDNNTKSPTQIKFSNQSSPAWDDASESSSSNESSSEGVDDSTGPLRTKTGEHDDEIDASVRVASRGGQSPTSSTQTHRMRTQNLPFPASGGASCPSRSVNTTPKLDNFEEVLMSVVQEVMSTWVKNVCHSVPDRSMKAIGIAASLALVTHMRCSPRARNVVMGVMEGTAAFGVAGIALTSIGTLVAKKIVDTPHMGSNIGASLNSRQEYNAKFLPFAQRIWTKIQQWKGTSKWKKWRNFTAMLILLYIGKMRRNRQLPGHNIP